MREREGDRERETTVCHDLSIHPLCERERTHERERERLSERKSEGAREREREREATV